MNEVEQDFKTLKIDDRLCVKLSERNIVTPTDIQQKAIPVALAGKDIVAQSQTGTGKTLAYLLPILQKIDRNMKHPQAVVIAPTQELAMQIEAECKYYGSVLDIESIPFIGGAALKRQIEQLKKNNPQLIIGTPGRLLELIKLRKLRMHDVKTIVLDEADQLFKLGDGQSIEAIIKSTLKDRQLLLFSATMPDEVKKQANEWMVDPVYIGMADSSPVADSIEHHYFMWEERDKIDLMRRLYYAYKPRSGLIFVNDSERITEIEGKLLHVGLPVKAIYGQAGKQERSAVMRDFRSGEVPLLLATDMAARGLDVERITHVFHFDLPVDANSYVHRAGRTGRMGRTGIAVCLASKREQYLLDRLERQLGIVFREKAVYKGKVVDKVESQKMREKHSYSKVSSQKSPSKRMKRGAHKR